jgi:hypothetical protein
LVYEEEERPKRRTLINLSTDSDQVHQFLSMLQQQQEEIHGLPRESNTVAAAPDLVGEPIDLELSEAVHHGG